jgi:hypothetical protein
MKQVKLNASIVLNRWLMRTKNSVTSVAIRFASIAKTLPLMNRCVAGVFPLSQKLLSRA